MTPEYCCIYITHTRSDLHPCYLVSHAPFHIHLLLGGGDTRTALPPTTAVYWYYWWQQLTTDGVFMQSALLFGWLPDKEAAQTYNMIGTSFASILYTYFVLRILLHYCCVAISSREEIGTTAHTATELNAVGTAVEASRCCSSMGGSNQTPELLKQQFYAANNDEGHILLLPSHSSSHVLSTWSTAAVAISLAWWKSRTLQMGFLVQHEVSAVESK